MLTQATLESILDSITDAHWIYDKDLRLVFINRGGEQLARRSRQDLLGKGIHEVYPELANSEYESRVRKAMLNQEADRFEFYFERNDRWYEVSISPAHEGLSVYARDI